MNIQVIVIALVLIVGGAWVLSSTGESDSSQTDAQNTATETEKEMMEKDVMEEEAIMEKESEAMMEKDTMMEKEEEAMMEKESEAMMEKGAAGVYTQYSESELANAQGDIVLFFHASWCPSCRNLDANISASADDIPSDLTILKLDYDSETALRQKYGVTRQHTLVQVDSSGNMIKSWSGGSTLDSIVNKL